MDLALSDPTWLFSSMLASLEGEGNKKARLPNLLPSDYENDLTCLIADEVLGLSIAKYIGGDKGLFDHALATTRPAGPARPFGTIHG